MSWSLFNWIEKASLIHDGEVNVIGVSETDSAALFDFLDSSTTQEDAAAPAATAIAAEEQEEDFVRFLLC